MSELSAITLQGRSGQWLVLTGKGWIEVPEQVAGIVTIIDGFSKYHGYQPTVRDISDRTYSSSSSTIHHWLREGKALGVLTWEPGKVRTLRCL